MSSNMMELVINSLTANGKNASSMDQQSILLDFELAGYGNRDFDIAWALFRRPGQKFLKTEVEQKAFLRGYQRTAPCDQEAVKYYMAQCYVYFLQFSGDDAEYCDYIRTWVKRLICKRY